MELLATVIVQAAESSGDAAVVELRVPEWEDTSL